MKKLYDRSFVEFYKKQFPKLVGDPEKQTESKKIVDFLDEITRPKSRFDVFETFILPPRRGATTLAMLAALYVGGVMKIPTAIHIEGKEHTGPYSPAWELYEMLREIGLDPDIVEPYSGSVCLSSHVFTARRPILFHLDDRHPVEHVDRLNHSVITIAKIGDQRWH